MKQSHTKTSGEFVAAPESEDFFEMTNLSPKRTGLPFVVWISPKSGAPHDVRVKISRVPRVYPSELISVAVRPDVHVARGGDLSAQDLALLNWDGEIEYTEDAIARLRPIHGSKA